jgi:site-specific recombinase XerD
VRRCRSVRRPASSTGRRAGRPRSSAAPAPARHAVELAHEGVPLNVIQRQLGHANLGTTSIFLQGIENAEIIDTVHARRAPMTPATTALDR